MTGTMPAIGIELSDADLVSASRNGDREAFGQIVRRYQGMISGLIYAACGDLHRSEDLAQETFLSAWKSLSGLREPAKLPAWLCQIARHRAQDEFRKSTSERIGMGGFWARLRLRSAPPDEQLAREEEQAILWRALAEIPQPYRETLVLYYRQNQSTEQVATAMETSEESVRQRLSRGREMLRGQVAAMLERNLKSTAPGPAFALAVVAALPALATQTAKAASVGTAVKGSLGANSSWLASVSSWLIAISGIAGGVAGSYGALCDDRTRVERKLTIAFLVKLWLLVVFLVAGCAALFRLRGRFAWSDEMFMSLVGGLFFLYWALASTTIVLYQARSRRVREPGRPLNISIAMSTLVTAGTTVGALGWLINLSLSAGDRLGAVVAASAIIAISAVGVFVFQRATRSVILFLTLGICASIVTMLNWRLDSWVAALRGIDPATVHLPLWPINCLAVTLALWVSFVTGFANRDLHGETV